MNGVTVSDSRGWERLAADGASTLPEFADVEAAAVRIAPYVHRTPVVQSTALSRQLGAEVFLKCEQLQKVGAFKARGACNAVWAMDAARVARGVVTHSSGNHAAALARAAALRGVPAWVVMPSNAPKIKQEAVRGYGATIIDCAPTMAAREAAARELMERTGAILVHPYDDPWVIAGQGTAALEFSDQIAAPDVLLVPVGGGGLLSGSALVARTRWPQSRIIGVEPLGADDAARGFRSGQRQVGALANTIADGLRGELSSRTFTMITRFVDDIVTVSEAAIVEALRLVWHFPKLVIEPSAAVAVAALLEGRVRAGRVGIVLSGGNVDFAALLPRFVG